MQTLAYEENDNGFDTLIEAERIYKSNGPKVNLAQRSAMHTFRSSMTETMRMRDMCCSGVEVAKKLVKCEMRECSYCGDNIRLN